MIDAGVGIRSLKMNLSKVGLSFDSIHAVLITHDHSDHIRSLGSYCKRLGKPVYMTKRLLDAAPIHWMAGDYLSTVVKTLPDSGPAEIVEGSIFATPFEVPHDASQTVGYNIQIDGYKLVIMTDIGRMTEEGLLYAKQANTVIIEANYDPDMLRFGSYPIDLQRRIRGGNGHLSNGECAQAVREFLHPELSNIFLCHLSAHNNTPELALSEVSKAIEGCKIRLVALPRTSPSAFYQL